MTVVFSHQVMGVVRYQQQLTGILSSLVCEMRVIIPIAHAYWEKHMYKESFTIWDTQDIQVAMDLRMIM